MLWSLLYTVPGGWYRHHKRRSHLYRRDFSVDKENRLGALALMEFIKTEVYTDKSALELLQGLNEDELLKVKKAVAFYGKDFALTISDLELLVNFQHEKRQTTCEQFAAIGSPNISLKEANWEIDSTETWSTLRLDVISKASEPFHQPPITFTEMKCENNNSKYHYSDAAAEEDITLLQMLKKQIKLVNKFLTEINGSEFYDLTSAYGIAFSFAMCITECEPILHYPESLETQLISEVQSVLRQLLKKLDESTGTLTLTKISLISPKIGRSLLSILSHGQFHNGSSTEVDENTTAMSQRTEEFNQFFQSTVNHFEPLQHNIKPEISSKNVKNYQAFHNDQENHPISDDSDVESSLLQGHVMGAGRGKTEQTLSLERTVELLENKIKHQAASEEQRHKLILDVNSDSPELEGQDYQPNLSGRENTINQTLDQQLALSVKSGENKARHVMISNSTIYTRTSEPEDFVQPLETDATSTSMWQRFIQNDDLKNVKLASLPIEVTAGNDNLRGTSGSFSINENQESRNRAKQIWYIEEIEEIESILRNQKISIQLSTNAISKLLKKDKMWFSEKDSSIVCSRLKSLEESLRLSVKYKEQLRDSESEFSQFVGHPTSCNNSKSIITEAFVKETEEFIQKIKGSI